MTTLDTIKAEREAAAEKDAAEREAGIADMALKLATGKRVPKAALAELDDAALAEVESRAAQHRKAARLTALAAVQTSRREAAAEARRAVDEFEERRKRALADLERDRDRVRSASNAAAHAAQESKKAAEELAAMPAAFREAAGPLGSAVAKLQAAEFRLERLEGDAEEAGEGPRDRARRLRHKVEGLTLQAGDASLSGEVRDAAAELANHFWSAAVEAEVAGANVHRIENDHHELDDRRERAAALVVDYAEASQAAADSALAEARAEVERLRAEVEAAAK